MSFLVHGPTISDAWLEAVSYLDSVDGTASNLLVAAAGPQEDASIRAELEAFNESIQLANKRPTRPLRSVESVANTIFPADLYAPEFGREAARRLYENHRASREVLRRFNHGREEYFDRMIDWPTTDRPLNQLERVIENLQRELKSQGPKGSIYEIAVSQPVGEEIRIQDPERDKSIMGFPCLSHLSFTLRGSELDLVALYRNQHFISKAYGNLLGLSRLGCFVAREAGLQMGEVACLASHADLEIGGRAGQGRGAIRAFLDRCASVTKSRIALV